MKPEQCKFYLPNGKCSHKDAPEPWRTGCLGIVVCASWEDGIEEKAVSVMPTIDELKKAYEKALKAYKEKRAEWEAADQAYAKALREEMNKLKP